MGQRRALPTYDRPGVNALAASNEARLRSLMGLPTFTNQPREVTNAMEILGGSQ
jgi:hypothetical protein